MKKRYHLQVEVWLYPCIAGWHFITLPQEVAKEIKETFGSEKRGWGSLPVKMTIGKMIWETSIFPDKKSASYLLPLKAEVRKKEVIKAGDIVDFSLEISD